MGTSAAFTTKRGTNLKKLEYASYIAVISAAMLLSYVLVTQHLLGERASDLPHLADAQANSAEGKTLNIKGIDWAANNRSLVLAVSSHCGYCIKSAGFYHKLADFNASGHPKKTRLVAVLPEDLSSAEAFFKSNNIRLDGIAKAQLSEIDVQGTPTVLLVDSHGKVIREWMGFLDSNKEQQVLAELSN